MVRATKTVHWAKLILADVRSCVHSAESPKENEGSHGGARPARTLPKARLFRGAAVQRFPPCLPSIDLNTTFISWWLLAITYWSGLDCNSPVASCTFARSVSEVDRTSVPDPETPERSMRVGDGWHYAVSVTETTEKKISSQRFFRWEIHWVRSSNFPEWLENLRGGPLIPRVPLIIN